MATPRALILRAPGTNCDEETAFAFEQAGAPTASLHINALLESPAATRDYQILCLPGGFSYGDDLGAGRILANKIRYRLADVLREFRDAGKLMLGICNGFQVLMRTGLLVADDPQSGPQVTLTANDCGHFVDRWVWLRTDGMKGVFFAGFDRMYLPVAHAEGKFVARDAKVFQMLQQRGQLVLRYTTESGAGNGEIGFPANPNGSQGNVAGMCDATGRVCGLMPHPERHIDPTQHPRWTRRKDDLPTAGDGLRVFQNAVEYFR